MGGIPIEEVRKMKLLQLSWSDHVDYIAVKMGQGVAMTRKCSHYVTPSVRNQVIQALVLSHLGSVWLCGPALQKNV